MQLKRNGHTHKIHKLNNSKNTPVRQTSVYRRMLNTPLFLLALYVLIKYLCAYKIFIECNSNGDCDINMNEFKFENALQ